eukprot:337291-Hanusia_phi.AAC.1
MPHDDTRATGVGPQRSTRHLASRSATGHYCVTSCYSSVTAVRRKRLRNLEEDRGKGRGRALSESSEKEG